MSISISAISKSEIPQPAEEIERWRRETNNGEGNSPMLSRGELAPKMQSKCNFYITLAQESPQRTEESDASTYDINLHSRETDICRDSSDTDTNSSFTFDGIATMEVLEYEVRSSSSSEDLLYSNISSSGSDEEFLLAAVAAGAMCETSSSFSSGFADTEESDSDNTFDPEFSAADYWVCVKCKNKQNNPMFRYCEKCYQIRKSHFPPRPKQWKSRTKKQRKTLPSVKEIQNLCAEKGAKNCIDGLVDKDLDADVAKRLGKFDSISKNQVSSKFYSGSRKFKNISKSQLNSAAETSSEDDFSDSYTKKVPRRKSRSSLEMKVDKLITNATSSRNVNVNDNLSNSLVCSKSRKRKELSENVEAQPSKKMNMSESKINYDVAHDSGSETDSTGNIIQLQKDSGISSAPPSSQDVPSSCLSDDRQNPETANNGNDSSDDTVCEELDAKDIADLKNLNESHVNVNNLGRHMSDVSSLQSDRFTQSETNSLRKSISACTEEAQILSRTESQSLVDNLELSTYGSCIVCLSEPKNGVFVHSKFVHLCCCYKCAVKIWNKSKRCPVCNCTVKNVMKLSVH